MRCDPTEASALINDIRSNAKIVRAYGTRASGCASLVATPTALHLIAAHMESEMRSWLHTDHTIAATFSEAVDSAMTVIEFPLLRTVPTVVTPSVMAADLRATQLRAASHLLTVAARSLVDAFDTTAAHHHLEMLATQAARILAAANAVAS